MEEDQTPAADEMPEQNDLGEHVSAQGDRAEETDEEDLGRHASAPEEGARDTEMVDLAQHGSAPHEAALGAAAAPAQPPPAAAAAPNWDRVVIVLQLAAGVALVVFGALLAALTKEGTHDIGTAVIGVGAALIPAGAAASATARISKTNSGG